MAKEFILVPKARYEELINKNPTTFEHLLPQQMTHDIPWISLHWATSLLINVENIRAIVIHKGIDSITTINKQKIYG
jgi:hypothetical protein